MDGIVNRTLLYYGSVCAADNLLLLHVGHGVNRGSNFGKRFAYV